MDDSLRIAVLGCGNIGNTFAFHLARAGHDVTAIARPGSARLAQLRRDGSIVDVKGGRVAVRVADRLDATIPYDLVIVTLLAHQAVAVLPTLQASTAACVQFMFNSEALGETVYPQSKRRIDRLRDPIVAGMLWSLSRVPAFRDLLATGEVECAALVDAMLAAAPRASGSVQTSALDAMRPL